MKNIFTLLAILPLAAAALAADTPPCKLTFASQDEFDKWKTVDANGDGNKYMFLFNDTEQAAYYTQNKSRAADDWLISPAVTLTAGKQYTITVSARNYSTFRNDANDFTVSMGGEQTVESMNTEILNVAGLTPASSYSDKSSDIFTVDATGDYCFGIHLVSKSYQGDLGIKSFTVAEFVELPAAVTGAVVTPAALGEMTSVVSWTYPSKNSNGGTLSSLTGVRIYREYRYKTFKLDDDHLVATIDKDATPGGAGSYTDTGIADGRGTYYYAIVPYNENGASLADPEVVSAWIGEETDLKGVENLKAVTEPDNDSQVLLSWTVPPKGANGAYVNPEKISYRIERDNNVLEESWTGTLPYRDTTIPGAGSYTYTVKALYEGNESLYSSKATVTIKGIVDLPYTNTFENTESVAFLTFVHAAPGKNDWGFSSKAIRVYEKGNPNAYAFMPPFRLEADKNYCVRFSTRLSGASSKNLAVVYGNSATADGSHTEIFREVITGTDFADKSAIFTVPADGKYFIGFLFDGTSTDYKDLYVDNVEIAEIVTAPARVSDFTATGGAAGSLQATLSWTNPATTNTGNELTSLSKVAVSRNGTEIKVFENPVPGSQVSFTDTDIAAPGFYTYEVTPYLDDNAGEPATATTGWVGNDTPKAPASVSVTVGDDGRTVTFDPVTESLNGGYMPAGLTYTVHRNGTLLATGLAAKPFTDSEADLPLGFYTYSVSAGYDAVSGAAANSEAIKLGECLRLPYTPDFTDSKEFELWTLDRGSGKNDWALDNQWYNGLAIYGAYKSWAYTPPFIALKGVCTVTFMAACQNTTAEKLTVCLMRDTEEDTDDTGATAAVAAASDRKPEVVGTATEYTISEPWSGSEFTRHTLSLAIPDTGRYYIGFGANASGTAASSGRFVLKHSDIEQSKITYAGDIAADGTEFKYSHGEQALVSAVPGHIEVYSLDGILLLKTDGTSLRVDRLDAGIYLGRITRADGSANTLKFAR